MPLTCFIRHQIDPFQREAFQRYAYRCLDWSERRDHLAGRLADDIFAHLAQRGWLRRADGRVVVLTPEGRRQLLPRLLDGGTPRLGEAVASAGRAARES